MDFSHVYQVCCVAGQVNVLSLSSLKSLKVDENNNQEHTNISPDFFMTFK